MKFDLCRHLREGGLARGEAGDQGSQSWIIPIGLPTANLELYKDKAKNHVEGEKDTTHGLPGSDRFSGAGEKLADDDNDLKR